jgi:hypothetical protein
MADNIDSIKTKLPILEGDAGVAEDVEGIVYNVKSLMKKRVYDDIPITKLSNSSIASNVEKLIEVSPGVMVLMASGYLYKYENNGLYSFPREQGTDFLIVGDYIYLLTSIYIIKYSMDVKAAEIQRVNIQLENEGNNDFTFDYINNVFWICYRKGSFMQLNLNLEIVSTFKKTTQYYRKIEVDSLGNLYVAYTYPSNTSRIDKYDRNGNLLLTKQVTTAVTYYDFNRMTINVENNNEYLYSPLSDGGFAKLDLNLEKVWRIVYSSNWGYRDFTIKDGYIYLLAYGSNDVTSFLYIYDTDKNMQNFCSLWRPVDRGVSVANLSNNQIFVSGSSSDTSVILQEHYTEIDPGYALIEKR